MLNIQDNSYVSINGEKVYINGVSYNLPKAFIGGTSVTTINGKVYVNGYELKNGKWKITLRSLFHLFF